MVIKHFWKDTWCGSVALKELFPYLYSLETNEDCLVFDKVNDDVDHNSRWMMLNRVQWIPLKVNCFVWMMLKNRILI